MNNRLHGGMVGTDVLKLYEIGEIRLHRYVDKVGLLRSSF